jgi:ribosomal protein L7/L12
VSNDQSLQARLKDAIARGDKDAAMALMRQGGIGGLLQTLRAVQAAASDQAVMASATSAIRKSGMQVPATVKDALQQGNVIEAVKRLREANPGLSLKAARDHVDALGIKPSVRPASRAATTCGTPRDRVPTVMMGDKPGGLRWLFVLIAFAAIAWWWSTT